MRLICPNCDAQYAVDDHAIPDAGRDVQCSSCGHAWFQLPDVEDESADVLVAATKTRDAATAPAAQGRPVQAPAIAAAKTDATPARGPDQTEIAVDPGPEDDRVAAILAKVRDLPTTDIEPEAPETPAPVGGPKMAKPSEGLDEGLLSILREEAAREAATRKREASRGVEMQPDLGLEIAAAPVAAASAALAKKRVRNLSEDDDEDNDRPAARRDLLPDIEEINSTLRASDDNRPGAEPEDDLPSLVPEPRGAFSRGFTMMLVIAVVLGGVYVAAPRISAALPAAAPYMEAYVSACDAGRRWLDVMVKNATAGLQKLTGNES